MANRVLEAKRLKIAKATRKAYLKIPRNGGVDTGKIAAHAIFQNRSRVNTTQGKANGALPVLDNTWMQEIPETVTQIIEDREYNGSARRSDRRLTLDKADALAAEERQFIIDACLSFWQGTRRQGVNVWVKALMEHHGDYRCYMLTSGNKYLFYWENTEERGASRIYEGREAAMSAFRSRISWVFHEKKPISK